MIKKYSVMIGLLMSLAIFGGSAMANDENQNNGNGAVTRPLGGKALSDHFYSRRKEINATIGIHADQINCSQAWQILKDEYEPLGLYLSNFDCLPDPNTGTPQVMQREN